MVVDQESGINRTDVHSYESWCQDLLIWLTNHDGWCVPEVLLVLVRL